MYPTPVDAETLLIEHLRDVVAVPVVGIATTVSGRFVQVRSTGGAPREYVGVANVHQLTVTTWGAHPADAYDSLPIAAEAFRAVGALQVSGWLGSVPCSAVAALSLPYSDPDPSTGRARYSFTCRLHLRATIST